MATYDPNKINYDLAIEEAVKRNDYGAAAKLEQARNEKIGGMSAEDIAKWGVSTTDNYSQYLGQSSVAGSAKDTIAYNDHQRNIQDQMNYNSYLWYGADDATKDLLHAENQGLSMALDGTVSFDTDSGYWSNTGASTGGGGGGFGKPTWDPSVLGDKPVFDSKHEQDIDALLDQILNREDFEYNVWEDDLYQQYKEQYNREGDRSMNDTLAAAASSAGGMNSYAITAAQQANDYYAAQLTDKIPELYQLAYEMYLDDIDMQVRDLGLLTDMDDTQYGRYRDTMGDWYNDRDFSYNKYRDDVSDYKWQQEFDRDSYRDNRDFNYGVTRDNVSDNMWQQSFDREGAWRDDDTTYERNYDKAMLLAAAGDFSGLKALGYTDAQIKKLEEAYEEANAPEADPYKPVGGNVSSGSGGSSSTSRNNALSKDISTNAVDGSGGAKPSNTINSPNKLSNRAQQVLSGLSTMKDSMSNRIKDSDGMYPVEKSILVELQKNTITEAEAEYLMRYFGYDASKHFDY